MEQDFYGPVQGPARSPNSQQSSPRRSLSGQFPYLYCTVAILSGWISSLHLLKKLNVYIFPPPFAVQRTPSRLNCAAKMSHQELNSQRAEKL